MVCFVQKYDLISFLQIKEGKSTPFHPRSQINHTCRFRGICVIRLICDSDKNASLELNLSGSQIRILSSHLPKSTAYAASVESV
jgi:hypothetical protein